jgi:hypothetical protein
VRERVVEDQHARSGQQGPGQCDPLALAAGEGVALLSDDGVEPLRQARHHVQRRGPLQRRQHLVVVGVGAGEGDVVAERGREELGLLVDHCDRAAQRLQGEPGHVLPVEQDPPRARLVQPRDQRGQGRLARTGAAHQGDPLPGLDLEADADQARTAALAVPEADVVETDAGSVLARCGGGRLGQAGRARAVGDARRAVEDLEHPLGAGGGALREAEQHAERLQRPDEHDHVGVEGDQRAQGDAPVDHQPAAVPEDDGHAELGERGQQRGVEGPQPRGGEVLAEQAAGLAPQLVDLLPLAAERLDHAHAGGVLLDHGGQVALLLLDPPVDAVQPPVEAHRPVDQRRCQRERDQREPGRQRPHLDGGDPEGEEVEHAEDQAP